MTDRDYIIIVIIALSFLGTGAFTIIQYIDGKNSDKERNAAQQRADSLATKLLDMQSIALDKSKELIDAQKDAKATANLLISAQSDNIRLQGEVLKSVTGDGYPILDLITFKDKGFKFFLRNPSDYVMRFREIAIMNSTEAMKKFTIVGDYYQLEGADYKDLVSYVDSFELTPQKTKVIDFLFPRDQIGYYIINCKTAHVTTIQYSAVQFRDNQWFHEYRIFEVALDNTTYKLIHDNSSGQSEAAWRKNFPYMKSIELINF